MKQTCNICRYRNINININDNEDMHKTGQWKKFKLQQNPAFQKKTGFFVYSKIIVI